MSAKRLNFDFRIDHLVNLPNAVKKLRNLAKHEDPTIYSGQYEGDIIISPEQMEYYKARSYRRNGW